MKIALPTCANLRPNEMDDDPLHEALQSRGLTIDRPIWDDPSIDWACYRACLIRTTWDYQYKREAFVAWAERIEQLTELFNPAGVVRWNTHKSYLADLERRGVPIVPTVWLEHGQTVDIASILDDRGWEKAFLKPAIGATSRGTLRFTADASGIAEASAHVRRLIPTVNLLLQPYLDAVETRGEVSAIFFDGEFSHAVRKMPVPGDYRVQDDFGATDEPTTLTRREIDLAQRCIEAATPNDTHNEAWPLLYARVDFLQDCDGNLQLIELELVEPSLFFRHAPQAANTLASALCTRLDMA